MANSRIWGKDAAKLTLGVNLGLRNSSQAGFAASIVESLFQYCQELDDNLDHKTGLTAKYFSVPPLSKDKEAEERDSQKRKAFLYSFDGLENPFYVFCQKLYRVMEQIQASDIKTICTDQETALAQEFRLCVAELNEAGFYNVNGKPINFWSGEEAQELANTVKTSLSDSNVPAISILSRLGNLLKEKHRGLSDKVFAAGSAEFTGQAQGDVIVYSSAANINETEPLLTVGNFHWNVELPILQRLRQAGIVLSIKLAHYVRPKNHHENESWFAHIKKWFKEHTQWFDVTEVKPASLSPETNSLDLAAYRSDPPPDDDKILPCDSSYVQPEPIAYDKTSVALDRLQLESAFVQPTSIAFDAYPVDLERLKQESRCDTSSVDLPVPETPSSLGHWRDPVDINKTRLAGRRRSSDGTLEQKKVAREKWGNEGEERGYSSFPIIGKYIDRWRKEAASRSRSRNGNSSSSSDSPDSRHRPQSPSPVPPPGLFGPRAKSEIHLPLNKPEPLIRSRSLDPPSGHVEGEQATPRRTVR